MAERDDQDRPGERLEDFYTRLGISDATYPVVLDAALTHAGQPRAWAAAAPPHWIPIGPRNVGGRIVTLAQDPTNPLVLYAGSAFGGLWRTADGGDTWQPLGGANNCLPVGALDVSQQRADTLYVGTGDPLNRSVSGRGLFRVTIPAGGAPPILQGLTAALDPPTNAPSGATNGVALRFTRIQVDPQDGTAFWAGSPTGLWRCQLPYLPLPPVPPFPSPPPGIVWTRDFPPRPPAPLFPAAPPLMTALGGVIQPPNYVTDVVVADDPRAGGVTTVLPDGRRVPRYLVIYVAIGNVHPGPAGAPSPGGVISGGVFRGRFDRFTSIMTWEKKLDITSTGVQRIKLGLCKSQPACVYAMMVEDTAESDALPLFRSRDNGEHWTECSRPPYGGPTRVQPWYALALTVHPDNPDTVVVGMVDLYISHNGGADWDTLLSWVNYDRGDRAQHADQHVVAFDSFDHVRLWSGNDGGISRADLRRPPGTSGAWRKRSHGISAAQFYWMNVHSNAALPLLLGGGLQDNGSYVSFGGPTWYHMGFGDGGAFGFEWADPRRYYPCATFGSNMSVDVIDGARAPSRDRDAVGKIESPTVPDIAAPSNLFAVQARIFTYQEGAGFIGVVKNIPTAVGANQLLVGRNGQAYLTSTAPPITHTPLLAPGSFTPVNATVTALGVAPLSPANEWWIGNSAGEIFQTINASAAVPVWNDITPRVGPPPSPPIWARNTISAIAISPTTPYRAAIATVWGRAAGIGALPWGGTVWLRDHYAAGGWLQIDTPPVSPLFPFNDLPLCPITSLAFDPNDPTVLYAGTLVGVYVHRGLPPPGPPGAPPYPPAGPMGNWEPFNNGLPLCLVNDMVLSPDVLGGTSVLRCATYSRGLFECHVQPLVPVAGWVDPATLLYIRQQVIDDGLHPRSAVAVLNAAPLSGDPRLPAGLPAGRFDLISGYDIRVDAPPFSWFEDTIDGVEFDEDLATDTLVPGTVNFVYVQVHNRGWGAAVGVAVHLFWAPAVPPAVVGGSPSAPTVPAWPTLPADPVPAPWTRVASNAVTVAPGQPVVTKFEFTPGAALAGAHVALLAVCRLAGDAPAPTAAVTAMDAFLLGERRAAMRIAPVGPLSPVFIRDGVEDSGMRGEVAWGGRSPDIIVVGPPPPPLPADPHATFADLFDLRRDDRLRATGEHTIYVRVHNPTRLAADVDVELLQVKADVNAYSSAGWANVTPVAPASPTGANFKRVHVAAQDYQLAAFHFTPADPDPTGAPPYKAYLLIALIHSTVAGDRHPDRTGIDTVEKFWDFFRSYADAKKAALRTVRYVA